MSREARSALSACCRRLSSVASTPRSLDACSSHAAISAEWAWRTSAARASAARSCSLSASASAVALAARRLGVRFEAAEEVGAGHHAEEVGSGTELGGVTGGVLGGVIGGVAVSMAEGLREASACCSDADALPGAAEDVAAEEEARAVKGAGHAVAGSAGDVGSAALAVLARSFSSSTCDSCCALSRRTSSSAPSERSLSEVLSLATCAIACP
mmetsp:Transcript_37911/g.76034  ORF Transcript_37911/g.76034 Transcript_37911/m.76034 type:complete len:213 (-) Transcript_37911:418-1056(-)